MNTMPGFTAEATLYRTQEHYRMTGKLNVLLDGAAGSGAVVPNQLLMRETPWIACADYCAGKTSNPIEYGFCYWRCVAFGGPPRPSSV